MREQQYLDSVQALLDCPQGERERLLTRLGQAVAAYLEDVPEAGERELVANSGTPAACAAQLMEECDPGAVAAERRQHRHGDPVALLAVTLGVAAYLWANGGLVIIRLRDHDPSFWESLPSSGVIYDYDD